MNEDLNKLLAVELIIKYSTTMSATEKAALTKRIVQGAARLSGVWDESLNDPSPVGW